MHGPIYTELRLVRKRQQRLRVLRGAVLGLMVGSLVVIGLGMACWWAGWTMPRGWSVALLAGGLLVGGLIGQIRAISWRVAATAVDDHYQLKDRAVTALDFMTLRDPGVFHELQVLDARAHLSNVEPCRVVPWRMPRALPFALVALGAALVLMISSARPSKVQAAEPEPLQAILDVADEIEEDLKQFDVLAREEQNASLAQLVQQFRDKLEEMKQPGVSERQALSMISEMQATLAQQQAEMNTPLVDNQLQALGEAMSPAAPLENAGKSLQEGKFDKAAKELENVKEEPIDQKQAKAAQEKMERVAKSMQDAKLGQLSAAAQRMAKGLQGATGQLQKGSRDLAKQVRQHERRRRINQLLALYQDRLNECKSHCRNSYLAWIEQKKKSGPSSGAGSGKGDEPLAKKTDLPGIHQLKEIPGDAAEEGPSEVESTRTLEEGSDQAARRYREVYQKFRRKSDAVLDHEPIPLGHRQTIRTYFELIHPRNIDGKD
jgi:hypothetical protein